MAKKKATASTLSAMICKQTEEFFSDRPVEGISLYYGDAIPEKKLANAREAYARYSAPECPLVLYDRTVFGSGKKGILLTDKRLFSDKVNYRLETINSVACDEGVLLSQVTVNGEHFCEMLRADAKILLELFGLLFPVPSAMKKTIKNKKKKAATKSARKPKKKSPPVKKGNDQGRTSAHLVENFEKYAKFTKRRKWKDICKLNNVNIDSFGAKKELSALPDHLEDDEVVFAVVAGLMTQTQTSSAFDWGLNTWLVVLTNERFLFLDCAMLTSSVDTQSIRHDRVQAVSVSQGLLLGKIMIDLGSRMVVVDNCEKTAVRAVGDLANKWLRELEKKSKEAAAGSNTAAVVDQSPLEQIEKLATLHSAGILTEDEFVEAKRKILDKM